MATYFIPAPLTLCVAVALLTGSTVWADDTDPFAALTHSELIETDSLDDLRGRDSGATITTVQSDQHLQATITDSSFSAEVMNTGAITIAPHALDHFEGIGVFNIFTGHNNAVDAAVGVSIFISE